MLRIPECTLRCALIVGVLFGVGWHVDDAAATESPAGPTPVADPLVRAEAIAIEAKAAFRNKRFEHASTRFMDAYALSRSPALVYNAARAMQEAERWANADDLFTLYLGLDGVDETGRSEAEGHRAKVRAKLREANAGRGPAPPSSTGGADASTKRSPPPARARLGAFPVWQTVGAGAVAAGSVVAGVLATRMASGLSLENVQTDADAAAYREDRDRAERLRTVSIVCGVAGLGLAGWAVWELIGGDRDDSAAAAARGGRWRIIPSVSSGRAGLDVHLGY